MHLPNQCCQQSLNCLEKTSKNMDSMLPGFKKNNSVWEGKNEGDLYNKCLLGIRRDFVRERFLLEPFIPPGHLNTLHLLSCPRLHGHHLLYLHDGHHWPSNHDNCIEDGLCGPSNVCGSSWQWDWIWGVKHICGHKSSQSNYHSQTSCLSQAWLVCVCVFIVYFYFSASSSC